MYHTSLYYGVPHFLNGSDKCETSDSQINYKIIVDVKMDIIVLSCGAFSEVTGVNTLDPKC